MHLIHRIHCSAKLNVYMLDTDFSLEDLTEKSIYCYIVPDVSDLVKEVEEHDISMMVSDSYKSMIKIEWANYEFDDFYKYQVWRADTPNELETLEDNELLIEIVDKNISGQDALATKLYASQKELNAANNTLKSQLENRRIDLGELQLDADLFMHGDELDMQQYLKEKDIELSREELQQLDSHFTKKLSFE